MMNLENVKTDFAKLKQLRDDEIDFSDIPPLELDWARSAEWKFAESKVRALRSVVTKTSRRKISPQIMRSALLAK